MTRTIRWLLLVIVLAAILIVVILLRQVGLGEWGILIALFAWVFMVESLLFIGRRFWRGYRRGTVTRTKKRP